MSTVKIINGTGESKYIGATGVGTLVDPYFTVPYNTELAIARGLLPTHSLVKVTGENETSNIGIEEEVWEGSVAYTYPLTADITHIKTLVTDIPMQGVTVRVEGVDALWNLVTQDVVLGTPTTTLVALTTPLFRVNHMEVLSPLVNAQNIYLYNAAATVEYMRIDIGHNHSLSTLYAVPAGKTAYVMEYFGDVVEDPIAGKDPDSTEFKFAVADRAAGYGFRVEHERAISKGSGGFEQNMHHFKVTEKSDIKLTTKCTGKIGHVHGGYNIVLIDN